MENKMKVAVLYGGLSKEREVSLRSGAAVINALQNKGYAVTGIDCADKTWIKTIEEAKVDRAFLALHGKFGEDGAIQGALEWLKIPYTGCGVFSSALCFNKQATKSVLQNIGITMPQGTVYSTAQAVDDFVAAFKMNYPVIVKPNTEGSSIGLGRAANAQELTEALKKASAFDHDILIEELIEGREVTSSVLNGKALPLIEVRPKSGVYDYLSKYTKGMTDYLAPAPLDEAISRQIGFESEKIVRELGCEGAVRIDYMLNRHLKPYFLEVNTIPGMTETSLLPKAAGCVGLSFEELCEQILQAARLKI
ncbi:D-alanine--D-alanine ligase [bacterium]|nr:D-alanine--D-alanine ligase [bacterium]